MLIKFEKVDVKILHFFLIAHVIFFLRESKTYGYICEYNECTCVEEMITCIDITAPRFKFRPTVTKLYMENVQIVDINKMIHNLPNLKYVTLVNINYFNCKWLDNFPSYTFVRTNLCDSEDESLLTKISIVQSHTDANIPIFQFNEMEISQYKLLEELTTSHKTKYHNDAKITQYNSLDKLSTDSDSSYHYEQKIYRK